MELTPTTVAVGAYLAWLLAVVLLLVGRYSPAPLLPGVHGGVVTGAAAFFLLGLYRLGRGGWRRLAERDG